MGMYKEGVISCMAGEDLAQHRLVKFDTNTENGLPVVVYADTADLAIGTTESTVADGYAVGVKLFNAEGTHSMVVGATAVIAPGTLVYQDDDGKIDDSGTNVVGIATASATTANTEVEVIMYRPYAA